MKPGSVKIIDRISAVEAIKRLNEEDLLFLKGVTKPSLGAASAFLEYSIARALFVIPQCQTLRAAIRFLPKDLTLPYGILAIGKRRKGRGRSRKGSPNGWDARFLGP